jgi:adenosylcobinamide kinase / adenosylcobinamide-phosphate guanylyltransferase
MQIVLFTGGARSGKSAQAERYAARLAGGGLVAYLATAEAGDDEMRERIALHQARRPVAWPTLEAPLHVAARLQELETGTTVLLDCLTLLVSNLLLAHEADPQPVVDAEIAAMLAAAQERDLRLVVVSSEVGMGLVPEYRLGRVYRDLLGRASQQVAAAADEVYLVVAGIAVELRALQAAWSRPDERGAP